jgi:deoxyribodipyrimidine photo-lyase
MNGVTSPTSTTLVWLRRDLRLSDNPALQAAVAAAAPVSMPGPMPGSVPGPVPDSVLPVYLHSPEEQQPWAPGAASRWYLHHSLLALKADLERRGCGLMVARGDSLSRLLDIARRSGATRVFWNRVHEPAVVARDAAVKAALQRAGIEVRIFDDYSLLPMNTVRGQSGAPYRVFTPFWKRLAPILPTLSGESPGAGPSAGPLLETPASPASDAARRVALASSIAELGLLTDHRWHEKLHAHWQPGERSAQQRLQRISARLAGYPQQRDIPAAAGTSALSAALHFGEIPVRRLLAAWTPAWNGEFGSAAEQGADALIRQLAWREFAINLLYNHPQSAEHSLRDGFDDTGLWRHNPDYLRAWQRGQTGFALVDAGMRQLWQTGWMHNRVRMVAASLLTKNLGLHWIHGARWFWDTLVDADLANNSMGWQWVGGCGCDAAPYYRVFNPETQAKRFDPDRRYRRRWLDQTAPTAPLVELASSREAALDRYQNRSPLRTA